MMQRATKRNAVNATKGFSGRLRVSSAPQAKNSRNHTKREANSGTDSVRRREAKNRHEMREKDKLIYVRRYTRKELHRNGTTQTVLFSELGTLYTILYCSVVLYQHQFIHTTYPAAWHPCQRGRRYQQGCL